MIVDDYTHWVVYATECCCTNCNQLHILLTTDEWPTCQWVACPSSDWHTNNSDTLMVTRITFSWLTVTEMKTSIIFRTKVKLKIFRKNDIKSTVILKRQCKLFTMQRCYLQATFSWTSECYFLWLWTVQILHWCQTVEVLSVEIKLMC